MADADGSSVRIKVAQYFVNKELHELRDKNPQIAINTDDLKYLQALPRFYNSEHRESPSLAELPQLIPGPDRISWRNQLLQHFIPKPPSDPQFPPTFPPGGPVFPGVIWPSWYRVAIIGAGVAGLRTAKLLRDKGIPYKIFEASNRPGGRIFTYQFRSSPGNPKGNHDYYDAASMRYPDNKANENTFKLFKELGLSSMLIKYILSTPENIRCYNNIKTTVAVANTAGDHFKDKKIVPDEYLNKQYTDPWGRKRTGVSACVAQAYDPFRQALIDDFGTGWKKLMKYDWASTRSYLTREEPQYPLSVVHWMETRNSGTGSFDRAFSEAILSSLEYDDPTKVVEWKCIEGGSKVLIDAMLDKLTTKPFYGQRVKSVEQVYLPPQICFPDLPEWPYWPGRRPFPFMKVSISRKEDEYFSHVVSTASFAALNTINTEGVPMTYKQRHAIRTLNYGPSVKIAIKFKTRWWEDPGIKQLGGASYTDRQSRVVVYPSYGLGEDGPGVLMVTYNWQQDASRFGALIKNPDSSDQLDPDRERPWSEKVLLDQLYEDLAVLHGVAVKRLREETLDYHGFDWYHDPYTMGAFAHYAPGQYSTFFPHIVQPAAHGRFHFAGEVASAHHAWIAGALDSAVRVVDEILYWDFPIFLNKFRDECGVSSVFRDKHIAEEQFLKGLLSQQLEEAEFSG